jgi:hypothetical protein
MGSGYGTGAIRRHPDRSHLPGEPDDQPDDPGADDDDAERGVAGLRGRG